MTGTTAWVAILAAGAGCYLLKLAGLSVPTRLIDAPPAARIAALLPVALLSALVAVQVLGDPGRLAVDARVPAFGAAVVLLCLRAPFLVVVIGAALTAALLRLL